MPERKPKAIKELQGTFEPSRDFPSLEYETVSDTPEPAFPLDERGMQVWAEVCRDMKQVNLLRSRYLYELTNYCEWVSIYEENKRKYRECPTVIYTNKAGAENEQPSVYYKMMIEALEQVNQIGRQFGFTASSAERIRIKEQAPKKSKLAERLEKKINAA